MILVQILIFIVLWLISCIFCAAIGFFVANKAPKKNVRPTPEAVMSDDDERKQKKLIAEYENFIKYDGYEHEETIR